MAISPKSFPPRKRRPSAGSFISPKLSDKNLVQSLHLLSQEISTLKPLQFLQKRNSLSLIRKSKLLQILFEELLRFPVLVLSPSATLCFEELHVVLQRVKTLLEDCSNCSKMWLLSQTQTLSNNFHELTVELSTLLDIFPMKELDLNDDIEELVVLIRKQCSNDKPYVDPRDDEVKRAVLGLLDSIKSEIVPEQSKLAEIFAKLGLRDASSCREEIENLEEEVQSQNQSDEKSKSEAISLIGLVRYAKCVLFGASTPDPVTPRRKQPSEAVIPPDFRCPISLDLMRDPVVVATGQTYDRDSIKLWIDSGHATCPKTGQTLAHTELVPNLGLKNLIAMWCREQKIPFGATGSKVKVNGIRTNKTALEAVRMTVSFLVNKLSALESMEAATGVVYELRVLAKTDHESRACIAEAEAIPLLVRYLGSDVGLKHSNLQVNAVTTLLNLSILEENKTRIMETDGALNGIIEVLRSGATWEARGNAAATIFSLTGVHAHRKKLGRKARVIKGLMELAKEGPTSSRRDALAAILNLAGEREIIGKLIEGGVVQMSVELMDRLPEEAVTILESVVKRGGFIAIAAAYSAVKKLGMVLRDGSERVQESAAATLVTICRKGGLELVTELASLPGIERTVWELMATGTMRSRRKASTLLRILRRWSAGLDVDVMDGHTTTVTSSRIAIPS
ncbi:U-box domain-containing protein 16 [Quercus suber]|uniref:RING-type E3 ubiquitin transferase n=1 Tax=Quercus suber TaxID=58331 RepID=A0AAW0KZ83_QUESU|nr:U-box domain-containing protein 16 isoform X1 [Quercus suber]XP_023892060.1 U-box domain-containing protein 16 isoform X2 [Quercus suber]POE61268.1 u-box domain-containing protein 16 [Quercus suber]